MSLRSRTTGPLHSELLDAQNSLSEDSSMQTGTQTMELMDSPSLSTSSPAHSNDRDVQYRVTTFLNSRHFPAFRELTVDVENGEVTVSGMVDSYYEKQVALHSCQRVAGVLSLVDEISVNRKK